MTEAVKYGGREHADLERIAQSLGVTEAAASLAGMGIVTPDPCRPAAGLMKRKRTDEAE